MTLLSSVQPACVTSFSSGTGTGAEHDMPAHSMAPAFPFSLLFPSLLPTTSAYITLHLPTRQAGVPLPTILPHTHTLAPTHTLPPHHPHFPHTPSRFTTPSPALCLPYHPQVWDLPTHTMHTPMQPCLPPAAVPHFTTTPALPPPPPTHHLPHLTCTHMPALGWVGTGTAL